MKAIFYAATNKPREHVLGEAVRQGARIVGIDVDVAPNNIGLIPGYDFACMVGVKSSEVIHESITSGVPIIFFDKGYDRAAVNWRVAISHHQPTRYIDTWSRLGDRLRKWGWETKSWRRSGEHVLVAMGSHKYHIIADLEPATAYATRVINKLREITDRPIVYRPKPSWKDSVPIPGSRFSREKGIAQVLANCHALVTYGSNSCVEALRAGIPSIVLGDAVSRSISSTSLEDIEAPRLACGDEVYKFLCNLAYCQYGIDEIRSGKAWPTLIGDLQRHGRL